MKSKMIKQLLLACFLLAIGDLASANYCTGVIKGDSISDAQVDQCVKLAGIWTIATLPTGHSVQVGDTAYTSDGGGGVYVLTASGWQPIAANTGGPPTGAAGGGLTGTYPNPTVAAAPLSALPSNTGPYVLGSTATGSPVALASLPTGETAANGSALLDATNTTSVANKTYTSPIFSGFSTGSLTMTADSLSLANYTSQYLTTSDAIVNSGNPTIGYYFEDIVGDASATGNKVGLLSRVVQSTASATNANVVSIWPWVEATNAITTGTGAYTALNPAVRIDSGASVLSAIADESDVVCAGTCVNKFGVGAVSVAGDTNHGSSDEAAFAVWAGSTNGWNAGLEFTNFGTRPAIAAGGTLLKTKGSDAITNFINFISYTCTGNEILMTGLTVDCSGNLTAASLATAGTSSAASFNATTIGTAFKMNGTLFMYSVDDTPNPVYFSNFWGRNSGLNSNTTVSTKSINTCIGDYTCGGLTGAMSNSAFMENTALGFDALAGMTSGQFNTALGVSSLKAETTGVNNVAVGVDDQALTTGDTYSISIGDNAMNSGVNNNACIAIGDTALHGAVASTCANSIAIGTNAMSSASLTTPSFDIAIGSSALLALTGGIDNIAIGHTAGAAMTSNSNSTMIGFQSCLLCTGGSNTIIGAQVAKTTLVTGTSNVLVGVNSSMDTATTSTSQAVGIGSAGKPGSFDVAIGVFALAATTTDSLFNVGVGDAALTANTSGNSNVGIGKTALDHVTTGSTNVGIGKAGRNLTTGSNSVFIGDLAGSGSSALTGAANVGVGAQSLTAVTTTATNNAALGFQSGKTVTTGTNNVLIGPAVASTTLTTGSSNVVIGTSASCDTPAAASSNTLQLCAGGGAIISATGGNTPSTSASTVAGTLNVVGALSQGGAALALSIPTGTATFAVGSGVTSVACASGYSCNNTRGTLTIVGGTATTGTIATVSFSATLSAAPACFASQNGGGSLFDIGNSAPTTGSFAITSGVTVLGSTLNVNYQCQP